LDKLLFNETRLGNLIEITGKKGTGKTQISLLICAISSLYNKRIVYIDGSWNFRAERIKLIIDKYLAYKEDSDIYLKNIAYQRIFELNDLVKLIKKIKIFDFDVILFDDIIPMFIYNFKENMGLEVRSFIKDLSLITLSKKITIIFTNTITEKIDKETKKIQSKELFYHDIIRYVHYKFYLQAHPINKRITECKLFHPYNVNNITTDIDLSNL
jgi:RecA/RadA recombinase